jgi:superfamily I DNA/RNA helicase
LLPLEVSGVDGAVEERGDTVSVFNGPPPSILALANEAEEVRAAAAWLTERINAGVLPHEIGVFVRSEAQFTRAQHALTSAKIPFILLDDKTEPVSGKTAISTMHLAKGLEFRAVAVMACDDEIVPLQSRIEGVGDDADLKDVYDTERQLLYVACTRPRDHLLVTCVNPASEFIDDLRSARV